MHSLPPFAVHFLARPIKASPQTVVLFVRITIARRRVEISLKRRMPVENWDTQAGCAMGDKRLMQEINP
jgi:hypothetical protein